MIVLDTSVLVYAVGDPHPLRAPCQQLLRALADEALRATTTLEVVQEFAHVRSRRRPRADAVALAHDYAAALSPLLVVDEAALHRGLDLYENHAGLGSFDAVLAAATIEAGAEALVSTDGDFAGVDGLVHLTPSEALVRFGG